MITCPCCHLPRLDDVYAMTESTPSGCREWMGQRHPAGYGRMGRRMVHRLVMERLVGPLPAGIAVCHTCDNPPCVRLDHLFLGTQKDNVRDMWAKGRGHASQLRGSQIGTSKLTESQVSEIKARHRTGEFQNALARSFGVSKRTINLIVTTRSWKHVA